MSGIKRRLEKLEEGLAERVAPHLYGDQNRPASVQLLGCYKLLANAGLPPDQTALLSADIEHLTAYVAGKPDDDAEAQYAADLEHLRAMLRQAGLR